MVSADHSMYDRPIDQPGAGSNLITLTYHPPYDPAPWTPTPVVLVVD
jgi:hypothetical protein